MGGEVSKKTTTKTADRIARTKQTRTYNIFRFKITFLSYISLLTMTIYVLLIIFNALLISQFIPLSNAATVPPSGKRTVIITGGNRGIGYSACKELAATNEWSIILACQSVERGLQSLSKIPVTKGRNNIEVMELNLASLSSIKSFATNIISTGRKIDVLACNAGVQYTGSSQPKRTEDGFEATIGINHIGHFLLIQSLLDTIRKKSGSRIVIVGSGVHNPDEPGGNVGSKASLGDLKGFEKGFKDDISMIDDGSYDADKAYKDSKLVKYLINITK